MFAQRDTWAALRDPAWCWSWGKGNSRCVSTTVFLMSFMIIYSKQTHNHRHMSGGCHINVKNSSHSLNVRGIFNDMFMLVSLNCWTVSRPMQTMFARFLTRANLSSPVFSNLYWMKAMGSRQNLQCHHLVHFFTSLHYFRGLLKSDELEVRGFRSTPAIFYMESKSPLLITK